MRAPVLTVADQGDMAVLREMPLAEQKQYLERILLCPPNREVQIWATRQYLNLTDPETEAEFL